jgi:hypothetical protein
VRAYRCPEFMCDYKRESDRKLIELNPINRVFILYISKNKSELCNDNKIPILQYDKGAKHSLKTHQNNPIINRIDSEWKLFVKVVYHCLTKKENSIYY